MKRSIYRFRNSSPNRIRSPCSVFFLAFEPSKCLVTQHLNAKQFPSWRLNASAIVQTLTIHPINLYLDFYILRARFRK